jgi:hypothetical protein
MYEKALEISNAYSHHLSSFNANVSKIVTSWAANSTPDSELLEKTRSLIGKKSIWIEADDAELMKLLRQKLYDDSTIESEVCVFYDCDKNFVCRVERTILEKECFGNLFWMGVLCPHFKEFLEKLYE